MPENKIKIYPVILEDTMQYHGVALLHYKIVYPQMRSRKFCSAVNRVNMYYKIKALQFQKRCRKQLFRESVHAFETLPEEGQPHLWEAFLSYEITYNQNCTVSLYFDQYIYQGGAHGSTVRSSDTWNLVQVKQVRLRQLFCYYAKYKEYIIQQIIQQIEQQIEEEEAAYFEDYPENVRKNFDKDQFYLDCDGIVIYYQQYDIAPYSSGIPEFHISYVRGTVRPPTC